MEDEVDEVNVNFESLTGQREVKQKQDDDANERRLRSKENDSRQTTTDVTCNECQNEEAYIETQQTRASDEPPTKFLECKDCENTWRDYK